MEKSHHTKSLEALDYATTLAQKYSATNIDQLPTTDYETAMLAVMAMATDLRKYFVQILLRSPRTDTGKAELDNAYLALMELATHLYDRESAPFQRSNSDTLIEAVQVYTDSQNEFLRLNINNYFANKED